MKDKVIDMEVLIRRTPEDIFHALTDPASVKMWWCSPDFYRVTDFHLEGRVGGDWTLRALAEDGKPFEVRGQVLEYDRPKTLTLSWNPTFQEMGATTVRISLLPAAGGTILRLVHSGFHRDSPGYEPHLYGWPHILQWLTRWLESSGPRRG